MDAARGLSSLGLLLCLACSGEDGGEASRADEGAEQGERDDADDSDEPEADDDANAASDDADGADDEADADDDGADPDATGGADDAPSAAPDDPSGDEAPPGSATTDDADTTDDGSDGTSNATDDAPSTTPLGPSATAGPRLSQAELNNALRDLLGDGSSPASVYLPEDEFSPYDNDATRQTVSQTLVESMQVLAEDVAARLAHDPESRAAWLPCEPAGVRDEACFEAAVTSLGRAFFRRPFPQSEVSAYLPLLDFAEESGDFNVALELLLSALIQDPEFLYRLERGSAASTDGPLELNDYEVATRLSLLLWGSVPDAELLDDADASLLADPEARRAIAERLLADDRARRQLNRFHAMWLGYRAIPHSAELNAAFQLETESLIERVVFDEPQSYLQLFGSEQTYVNDLLAEHYGLPAPPDGAGWVNYADGSGPGAAQRIGAGILAHGSVLSGFSKFSDTSPTQRGIFVRTRLLCLAVPPPPANVDVDQPPSAEDEGACKLDRYRQHREQSGCVECHSLFEPIGEGLENFDMAGRYRNTDDDNPACVIEGSGTLPDYGEFSGPAELSRLLIDNRLVQSCFVKQYLQYALAKGQLTSDEVALAATLETDFEGAGLRLDRFLVDFVGRSSFSQKPAGGAAQ